MKIALKLNPNEIHALVFVMERTLKLERCDNRIDAIIYFMMARFYKKIKEKSILIEKGITLGVPPEIAMAFCEFYDQLYVDYSAFEGIVLLKILNLFNQKTASYYD